MFVIVIVTNIIINILSAFFMIIIAYVIVFAAKVFSSYCYLKKRFTSHPEYFENNLVDLL